MGRTELWTADGLKRGTWTAEEDQKLIAYIQKHGEGAWRSLPDKAGIQRCGKSCRLRWANYLRPGIKRGDFTSEEDQTIIQLHAALGNRWAAIARQLRKRTDNEVKNYWNAHLKKRLADLGIDPVTHKPIGAASICSTGNSDAMNINIHETAQESEPKLQQPITCTSSRSSSASALLLNKLATKLSAFQCVDPLIRANCQILQPNSTSASATGDIGTGANISESTSTAIIRYPTSSCHHQGINNNTSPDISDYWLHNTTADHPLSTTPLNFPDFSDIYSAFSPDPESVDQYGNASDDGTGGGLNNIEYPLSSDALDWIGEIHHDLQNNIPPCRTNPRQQGNSL